ncbi:hypothetical protein D3C87_1952760 [compost metagenome]
MDRDAIGIRAGLKLIGQTQLEIALMPEVRIVQFTDILRPLFNQHALFKVEQIRRLFTGVFPPAVEVTARHHIMADALIVEFE